MNSITCRLKTPSYKATQWFKDGDHPAVQPLTGWRQKRFPNTRCILAPLHGCCFLNPGDWVVESEDGIWAYTDAQFKEMFETTLN